jgi:hypothetical protein
MKSVMILVFSCLVSVLPGQDADTVFFMPYDSVIWGEPYDSITFLDTAEWVFPITDSIITDTIYAYTFGAALDSADVERSGMYIYVIPPPGVRVMNAKLVGHSYTGEAEKVPEELSEKRRIELVPFIFALIFSGLICVLLFHIIKQHTTWFDTGHSKQVNISDKNVHVIKSRVSGKDRVVTEYGWSQDMSYRVFLGRDPEIVLKHGAIYDSQNVVLPDKNWESFIVFLVEAYALRYGTDVDIELTIRKK